MRFKRDLERLFPAFLKQQRSPGGFGIEREQPAEAGRRRRMR